MSHKKRRNRSNSKNSASSENLMNKEEFQSFTEITKEYIDSFSKIYERCEIESECFICQKTMKIGNLQRAMTCTHRFHDECIVDFYDQGKTFCPVCNVDTLVPLSF